MEWLNPAGAWALLGAIPVIVLYVLKHRAVRVDVPSLLLWRKTQQRAQQTSPFQRLRNQLHLWLQLLMVLLLALALMRPVTAGGQQSESVFIFDLSASMQTMGNDGLTRLENAKKQALSLLDGMRDDDAVTILAAGEPFSQPLSRSTDHTLARSAVQALEAGNGGADLEGALSLARAMQRDLPQLTIYVFSDAWAEHAPDVTLIAAGEAVANRAVLDASVQPENGMVFARVRSYGAAGDVQLECYADGALCDVRTIELDADGSQSVRFEAPIGTQQALVRFAKPDALVVDDARYAVAEAQRSYTALLVTSGNVFLEQALKLMPELDVVLAALEDVGAATGCDLYVYDGVLPDVLPETGAIWAIDPPQSVLNIAPRKTTDAVTQLRTATGEQAAEICRYLTMEGVAIREYKALDGGTPVIVSGTNVLLTVTQAQGRRAAVLGFDLHDSNLPLKADFPVLVQNLLQYLLPPAVADVSQAVCGQPVSFTLDARCVEAYVQTPDGRQVALEGDTLPDTSQIGLYRLVELFADEQERETAFSLHIPQEESDTQTVAHGYAGEQNGHATASQREWTGWVILLLLMVAVLEWEVSRRGA